MLQIRNIEKKFGSQTALDKVNLEIKPGEFFSLLGPSGCGKSTLLRILAGLEERTSGEILWNGTRIESQPARLRPFNMVFQKYALFPHFDVFGNVAFGLSIKKVPSGEIVARVAEALELVNLKGFERRLPETLSGGQAQRVALARALVNRPSCLLLDEPLTALDQKLREHMQSELRLLQRKLGLTFIFVTHDQEEAMLMSDRIAVMDHGRIVQVSEPRELYENPKSVFSARFIGQRNELTGSVVRRDGEWMEFRLSRANAGFSEGGAEGSDRGRVEANLPSGGVTIGHSAILRGRSACAKLDQSCAGLVCAFVRPERLRVVMTASATSSGFNRLEGEVLQVVFRGVRSEVLVAALSGQFLRAILSDEAQAASLRVGDRVALEFSPEDTHVFQSEPVS